MTGAPGADGLLRKMLTGEPDNSVVLVQTGFCTNFKRLLESQPDVQKKLTEARDRLLAAADRTNHLNDQNVALIKQAIELNEFDLTLFKSLRQAPETANYDKTACNTGSLLGSSGFDAMS